VGAHRDDDLGENSGSSYVFRYNGSTWVEEQKLRARDGFPEDEFGHSVSVSDLVVVVGAWQAYERPGAAYVYRYDGSTWVEEQKLTASDGFFGDTFGESVAVSGDLTLIGATRNDTVAVDAGSVYVFRYDRNEWVEEQLTASDGAMWDAFGARVSVSGGVAVAAAVGDDDLGQEDVGSAYVFGVSDQDCDGNGEVDLCDIVAGNATDDDANFIPDECEDFIRGDGDANGIVNGLVDALFILSFQFIPGSPAPPCRDAADADDNGSVVGLTDGIYVLNYFFVGGSPPPPEPGPFTCGKDPTEDMLGCVPQSCP